MLEPDRDIRILLVGDPGVGKTSLIYALVNEEFADYVPPRMAEITIPADVTPQRVPSTITDYSQQEQPHWQDKLADEIQRANVVCLVYSAADEDSLTRVSSFWMPFIRQCQQHERRQHAHHHTYKPVILIRNKIDLNDSEGPLGEVLEIIGSHPEIEAYIDVSAKQQQNVSELFVTAQKTILYPLTPLYDIHMRSLTRKCRLALTRVFHACDLDQDNLLNDHEINELQTQCFGSPLQPETLNDVKAIIQQSIAEGVISDCITLEGFLFLHLLSIERGKHDITWTVLKQHGYGNDLTNADSSHEDADPDADADDYDDELDGDAESLESMINSMSLDMANHITASIVRVPSASASTSLTSTGAGAGATKVANDAGDLGWIRARLSNCFSLANNNLLLTASVGLTAATIISLVLFRYLTLRASHNR